MSFGQLMGQATYDNIRGVGLIDLQDRSCRMTETHLECELSNGFSEKIQKKAGGADGQREEWAEPFLNK